MIPNGELCKPETSLDHAVRDFMAKHVSTAIGFPEKAEGKEKAQETFISSLLAVPCPDGEDATLTLLRLLDPDLSGIALFITLRHLRWLRAAQVKDGITPERWEADVDIARKLGVSRDAITKAKKRLVERQIFEVETRRRTGTLSKVPVSHWRLHPHAYAALWCLWWTVLPLERAGRQQRKARKAADRILDIAQAKDCETSAIQIALGDWREPEVGFEANFSVGNRIMEVSKVYRQIAGPDFEYREASRTLHWKERS